MKILMTSESFLPLLGGGEIHVRELLRNLEQLGHKVVLITNQEGEATFNVVRIPWKRKNLFRLISFIWKESKTADVIHSHYSYRLAAIAMAVARIRRKKGVVTLHGMGTLNEPKAKFPYKQVHSFYRFLSLNLCHQVISTSEDLAKVARRHMFNPNKISIIFNGVDTKRFTPEINISNELIDRYKDNKVVLTVRRLVPKNGIQFLIEALPHVIKERPDVKYLVIGIGRLESYLAKCVEELGIGHYVEFLGELANEQIAQYLALADVVIFPSTAESSSIACAEAFSMGTPVVASAVGGLIELVGKDNERGTLVKLVEWEGSDYAAPLTLPRERIENFADVIVQTLNTDQTMKTQAAIRYAKEELDWRKVTEKTLEIYGR